MSGWGFIFKILKDANNTGQLGEHLAKQSVKRNRITENLIKNAEKYADNSENANELRRLATQIEQYQDDIMDLHNANKVLKNRQGEFVDTPYENEFIYTNDKTDAQNNIIRNLNEANFLQKQAHYARNDMNELLHEIMLRKQREINPRKLQLDEAIINLDKNNQKRMPVSPENRQYIAKRNNLLDNNKYNDKKDNLHKVARDYLDEHDLGTLGFSKFYE